MNQMVVCKRANGAVFVPMDAMGKPDLSRVPVEHREELETGKWAVYTVSTSRDKEIFDEVCTKGFSVQETVIEFQEKE